MTPNHHQSPDVVSWLLAAEEENTLLRKRVREEQEQRAKLELVMESTKERLRLKQAKESI